MIRSIPQPAAAVLRRDGDGGAVAFRSTKQVVGDDVAMVDFETTIDGTHVYGIDIIRSDDAGRIVEFRVMLRPSEP